MKNKINKYVCSTLKSIAAKLSKISLLLLILISLSTTFAITKPALANQLSSSEIDTLINQSIKIRLSDRTKFNENLVLLKNLGINAEQTQLSQKQQELILYLRGYAFAINGENEQAIKIYKQFEHSNNAEIRVMSLTAQLNIAIIYNDYSNSYTLIDSLLNDAEILDDLNINKNNAYLMVGYFYNSLGKFQLALNYFSLISRSFYSKQDICILNHHQALSYLGAKQITANDEFILTSINNCNLNGEVIIANSLLIENANALIEEQQYDLAITSLLANEQVILTGGFLMHNFAFHVLLTKAYTAQKNLLGAHISASAAQELAINFSKSMYALELFDTLTDLYLLDNQPEEALSYAQQHHKTKQLISDIELHKKMASAMARHQTVEQSKRLQQLLIDNKNSISTDKRLAKENIAFEEKIYLHFNSLLILLVCCSVLYGVIFWLKAYHQGLLNKTFIDPLTSIYSRRYFIDTLAGLIYKVKSKQQNLSLLTVTLDDLQRINNDYGFSHGDYILKQVVDIFKGTLQEGDITGRTGANEFCVALINTESRDTLGFATSLIEKIIQISSKDNIINYSISASIGISNTNTCNYVPKSLLSDSHKAMLLARQQGKNQVIEFDLTMTDRGRYIVEEKLKYIFK